MCVKGQAESAFMGHPECVPCEKCEYIPAMLSSSQEI